MPLGEELSMLLHTNICMFNVVASWLALCAHQKYTQLTMFCFSEDALRNASMFFRSEPTWSVVEPLKDIGESGVYQCVCSVFTSVTQGGGYGSSTTSLPVRLTTDYPNTCCHGYAKSTVHLLLFDCMVC